MLLAGSALLMAAAAVTMFPSKGKKGDGSSPEITEIDDDSPDEDYITEFDVCKIFDKLFLEMQGVLGQLGQQIQQLQMSGQQIPEAQLRQLLKAEFERALSVKQAQVYEENDVDADCLEEATWEFLDQPDKHPKAKMAVERFQKLWESVSGEAVVGKRPGQVSEESTKKIDLLSPEAVIQAAEVYFGSMTETMRVLIQRYKEEGKDLNSPEVAQQLNMEFSSAANEAGDMALGQKGFTLNQFQKSVEAHAGVPQVGRALQMLQMKNQQEMMAMGIPGM